MHPMNLSLAALLAVTAGPVFAAPPAHARGPAPAPAAAIQVADHRDHHAYAGHYGGYHGGYGGYHGGHPGYGRYYSPYHGYYGYRSYYPRFSAYFGLGYPLYGSYAYPYYSYYPSYSLYPYTSYYGGYDAYAAPYAYDREPYRLDTYPLPSTDEVAPPPSAVPEETQGEGAHITVRLPADALLWIEGKRIERSGAVRDFAVPPLDPNREYRYEVHARWTEASGEVIDRTQEVRIHQGDRATVDFLNPTAPRKSPVP